MQRQAGPDAAFLSRPQLYGGFGGFPRKEQLFYSRGQRHRLNILSVLQCLFLPWLMFCFTYAVCTFSLHYTRPNLMYSLLALGLVVVCANAGLALFTGYKKMQHDFHEPNWYIFLFVTMLIGWSLGMWFGNTNFSLSMQPFYDYANLNEYYYVDPARMRGAQMMDSGRVHFVNGTNLDLRRSMGFKNLDIYCVAPITLDGLPLASYDFWAVGIGCCSGNAADFACGEYNNPKATSGLRFLKDDDRAFFRLAVQQAEATYGIKATHPLFFYWTQDASGEMDSYREEGYRYYLIGMLAHFAWQLLVVGLAVLGFSRMGGI